MRVIRVFVGVVGELAVTFAVLLVAFVVWQLWWTDVEAGHAQAQTVTRMEQDFASPPARSGATADTVPAEARVHMSIPRGDAFALIRVPRFGSTFVRPVLEGTTKNILTEGVGHYVGTALPGEVGNFATAGHRETYGRSYDDIDKLRAGDSIVVETKTAYHVYAVTSHEVVLPSALEVIAPVPGQPGARPVLAMMTLTSCYPRYTSAERYVVHATLSATYTRAEGLPARILTPPKGA